MSARLLLAFSLLALLVVLATRGTGRAVVPVGPALPRPTTAPAIATPPVPTDVDSVRDPFRYGDTPNPAPPATRPTRALPVPTPTAPPEPPYRVVGVVSRDGRLVAALAIGGDVVLLAPGESADGITVLAVLEDGIRLRGPDGRVEVVPQP